MTTQVKHWLDEATYNNWTFALNTLGLSVLKLRPTDTLQYLLGAIALGLQAPNTGECSTDIHVKLQDEYFTAGQLNSTCREYTLESAVQDHIKITEALEKG